MTKNTKSAHVWLNYFKQGDDMHRCIEKDANGKINAKATIQNHIALMESVVEHLKELNAMIPPDNDIDIDADTHMIMIRGDKNLIDRIVNKNLAQIDDFEDDVEADDLEDKADEDSKDDETNDVTI
ncbi:MAG: hypothetical protein Hyperionvirus3_159 [Hyperionvirus sp.]|uniref:Uncharacterized protein n=1 Tax=Hyperionvirus sp. TaxID=2487770 RepID=A0A3G5AB05_9VIRU|nr:MAG: hypothetical protein Hyperionvirus3_159 [Hyperionvirus sp.]